MTPPVKFDRDWLYQRYVVDGLGTRAIAAERGCSMYGVISALRRFGIPVRKTGGQPTHGETIGAQPSTEYRIWQGMMKRCFDPAVREYPRYGGRGVTVCKQWQAFEGFLSDMGRRPSMDLTLDRINNDGDYEPGNCRWALPNLSKRVRTANSLTLMYWPSVLTHGHAKRSHVTTLFLPRVSHRSSMAVFLGVCKPIQSRLRIRPSRSICQQRASYVFCTDLATITNISSPSSSA